MTVDESHAGASQVLPRLEVMDQLGIWAQIVYPNTIGFGGHRFASVKDLELRGLAITIWNDAMAEFQEESANRLFPMGLLPWWDVEASVAEVGRVKELGLKGVNTNADPQNHGYPDLGHRQWDPLWSAIADAELPLNFHIGASAQQSSYFGDTPWGSQTDDAKLALGSAMIYLSNARVLGNFIFSGILERHPTLKLVSVESGIGWLPFVMEAMDWQLNETASSAREYLSLKPSEYFKRQIYACFWFESEQLVPMIEAVGVDRCMFETDFPHPTCLYPKAVAHVTEALQGVSADFREAVLSRNAARLYSISVP
jgi:predicted TIM-barrel fold metal-dependent hydrolase